MLSASTGVPVVLPWQHARSPCLQAARHDVHAADKEVTEHIVLGALA